MSTTVGQSSGENPCGQGVAPPAYSEEKVPDGPSPSYPVAPGVAPVLSYGPQYQQPVQYVVAAPYPTTAGYPKPDYPGPHSFIALVVTVTIICGLLDILSLAFGIPAIICALISSFKASDGNYPKASKFAMAGFILMLLNIMFTLLIGLMVSSLLGGYIWAARCNRIYRSCIGSDCHYECSSFSNYHYYYFY